MKKRTFLSNFLTYTKIKLYAREKIRLKDSFFLRAKRNGPVPNYSTTPRQTPFFLMSELRVKPIDKQKFLSLFVRKKRKVLYTCC